MSGLCRAGVSSPEPSPESLSPASLSAGASAFGAFPPGSLSSGVPSPDRTDVPTRSSSLERGAP